MAACYAAAAVAVGAAPPYTTRVELARRTSFENNSISVVRPDAPPRPARPDSLAPRLAALGTRPGRTRTGPVPAHLRPARLRPTSQPASLPASPIRPPVHHVVIILGDLYPRGTPRDPGLRYPEVPRGSGPGAVTYCRFISFLPHSPIFARGSRAGDTKGREVPPSRDEATAIYEHWRPGSK